MPGNDRQRLGNRLLGSLHKEAFATLSAHLETVLLEPREVLYASGQPIEQVYFPHSGIVCLMATTADGTAETAAIGPEGFVGFEAVLGGNKAASRALVQVAGSASRISIQRLRAALAESTPLRELLLRYVRFFLIQTLQSAACNSLHTVDERCAKWLLVAHDRAGSDSFNLTHEYLAEMLGVHRPSLTVVARTLQRAGLIRYTRGVITIADREGLEEAACECYGVVRRALEEILPPP